MRKSSDEGLHALCRVRLIRDHHHPVSVHVHGAQATLSVTDQAEHGFVKVLVLLLDANTNNRKKIRDFLRAYKPLLKLYASMLDACVVVNLGGANFKSKRLKTLKELLFGFI